MYRANQYYVEYVLGPRLMRFALRAVAIAVIVVVGAIAGVLVWLYATPAPFSLRVNTRPTSPMGTEANIMAIPGQRCILPVAVTDEQGWLIGKAGLGGTVEVSTQASEGKASVTIQPRQVTPGQVAEVIVIPTEASADEIFAVTITGKRYGLTRTETIKIEVISGEDGIGSYAAEMRDLFIPWLAANHPELGITAETEWKGTIVNPQILVVMHYIFYSDDWEIYLTWHVMIPPHDWTRIYLRHRFTELRPSYAFEISSVQGQQEPNSIEVPDWV